MSDHRDPEQDKYAERFDRGTRIYIGVLGAIVLAFAVHWLYTWIQQRNSPAGEINAELAADATLSTYPYPFHVLRVEGDTAVMASPRSPSFSVLRFLDIVHPELKGADPNGPELIAAQKELAHMQKHARDIALAHPGIAHVQWELDRRWLSLHGVEFYD